MALLVSLCSVLFAPPAMAFDEDQQVWLSLQGQGSFVDDAQYGFYLEAAARASNEQQAIYEKYFRPAITYKTQLGTYFLGTMVRYDAADSQVERRHWIQWSNRWTLDAFNLGVRFRQEHRELRGVSIPIYRTRIQIRVHSASIKLSETVFPFVSQEFFFNINDSMPIVEAGLVQVRTMIGLNVRLAERFQGDFGYLGVISNQTRRDDQFLHVLNIALQYAF
jgi:hypothetical protein